MASIILKWKKFGTTMTVPRAGCPAKLHNTGELMIMQMRWQQESQETSREGRFTETVTDPEITET